MVGKLSKIKAFKQLRAVKEAGVGLYPALLKNVLYLKDTPAQSKND